MVGIYDIYVWVAIYDTFLYGLVVMTFDSRRVSGRLVVMTFGGRFMVVMTFSLKIFIHLLDWPTQISKFPKYLYFNVLFWIIFGLVFCRFAQHNIPIAVQRQAQLLLVSES
jgi:hypothetical protein